MKKSWHTKFIDESKTLLQMIQNRFIQLQIHFCQWKVKVLELDVSIVMGSIIKDPVQSFDNRKIEEAF